MHADAPFRSQRSSVLRGVVDDLLELAIVPSFSRIGPVVRSRLWGWSPPVSGALAGRTALVTGATGGLGRAAAHELAGSGARVILVGRDPAKLGALAAELPGEHPIVTGDLSSLSAAADVVDRVRELAPVLDVLVDNAGAIFPERTASADGIESSMALMAIVPFALVAGLLPGLEAAADPRVIAVTSGGMYTSPLDVDDLDGAQAAYNGPRFYARAKRAQVALIREWARRRGGAGGITFVSMHPGWAATPGLSASLPAFERVMAPILRTPAEGVDTITWLATAPRGAIEPGRVYLDRRPRPFDRAPWTRLDRAARRRLWDLVVARAGIADPAPA